MELLERRLFSEEDLAYSAEMQGRQIERRAGSGGAADRPESVVSEADKEFEKMKALRRRSVPWIIGTSLAFEAVMLTLAAWAFCRRDY